MSEASNHLTTHDDRTMALAKKLVEFYSDFDFYDYQDNIEVGETQKEAETKMLSQLTDKKSIQGVIETLEDMQRYGGLTHKKMGQADALLGELEELLINTTPTPQQAAPMLPNEIAGAGFTQTM